MESSLGWTVLSRDALRRVENQLAGIADGVRDEIGFLALHQAYAERFFPGTSVQQTRLRYALFVPWIYERLRARGAGGRLVAELKEEERTLAGRLLAGTDKGGVIGRRVHPQATAIPPSLIYWTALVRWRLVRPLADGSLPTRAAFHRTISRPHTASVRLHDDEHQLLEESEPLFAGLPEPPREWTNPKSPLDFDLTSPETRYLRRLILATRRPGNPETRSLLSRLVDVPIAASTSLWARKIADAADADDRDALARARQAAALAAVGRAAYLALVESIRESDDGLPTGTTHRTWLREVIDEFRGDALDLDLAGLRRDAPGLDRSLVDVLILLKAWLKDGKAASANPRPLRAEFERIELRRKDRRARLATNAAGRERRAEWDGEDHPLAAPLHYRWPNTRRLILDLQAAR